MARDLTASGSTDESVNHCPCCGGAVTERLFISDRLNMAVVDNVRIDLTMHETAVLRAVQSHPRIATAELASKLYGGSEGPQDELKVIHVYIHRLRTKFKHTKLRIKNQWRSGYWLEWDK